MKIIYKLIYFGSIVFIITVGIVFILLKTLPLEFSDVRYEESFDSIFFFGIPIAIQLTLFRFRFKKNLDKVKFRTAVINTTTISISCFILFFLYAFATFGSGMCGWSSGETLYQNVSKRSERISKRYFGCGATDSSPATTGVFKTQNITPLFIYVTKVDTTKLDRSIWTRLKNE